MPITCICPKCRKPLSIAEQYAGQPMKCPFCAAMFQSPSLTAVSAQQAPAGTSNPFTDGAAAGYDGPTPPWQVGRRDPGAPEWPWLVGPQPTAAGGPAYNWDAVRGGEMRLAPGWHMVLRGMGLPPGALIVLYVVLVFARLFVLLQNPETETIKIILLVVIPVSIIAALVIVAGAALCCLVPRESRLRGWAIAAAAGVFFCMLSALMVLFLNFVMRQPGWSEANPGLAGMSKFVMGLAYVVFLLLFGGAGVSYLLFLRGVARVFDNKRLAQHLIWYLVFFALTPAFALFLFALFGGTARVLGLQDPEMKGAVDIIYSSAQFVLIAVVLAGFLYMLRETRITIERAISPVKA
jgi:hypothetical protein